MLRKIHLRLDFLESKECPGWRQKVRSYNKHVVPEITIVWIWYAIKSLMFCTTRIHEMLAKGDTKKWMDISYTLWHNDIDWEAIMKPHWLTYWNIEAGPLPPPPRWYLIATMISVLHQKQCSNHGNNMKPCNFDGGIIDFITDIE